MERLTKEEAGGETPILTRAPKIETYEWINKKTGELHMVPRGIDPGWDYHVGQAGFNGMGE